MMTLKASPALGSYLRQAVRRAPAGTYTPHVKPGKPAATEATVSLAAQASAKYSPLPQLVVPVDASSSTSSAWSDPNRSPQTYTGQRYQLGGGTGTGQPPDHRKTLALLALAAAAVLLLGKGN